MGYLTAAMLTSNVCFHSLITRGQFFDRYLKHINLNTGKVDFMSRDLSYLIKVRFI